MDLNETPGVWHEDVECSVLGCNRTTGMQTFEEREHGIALCDPSGPGDMLTAEEGNHFLQFEAARQEGRAARWVEENVHGAS